MADITPKYSTAPEMCRIWPRKRVLGINADTSTCGGGAGGWCARRGIKRSHVAMLDTLHVHHAHVKLFSHSSFEGSEWKTRAAANAKSGSLSRLRSPQINGHLHTGGGINRSG